MELKNGGADAVLIDNIMAEIYCKQNSDLQCDYAKYSRGYGFLY